MSGIWKKSCQGMNWKKGPGDKMKKYFQVHIKKYSAQGGFYLYRPASLQNPKDNAVMFLTEKYASQKEVCLDVKECLIYWPASIEAPGELREKNVIIQCKNPRLQYCMFFQENNITCLPPKESGTMENGSFIASSAVVADDAVIMPGAYIGGEVTISKGVYIGTGTRLVGKVHIAEGAVIRENSVIGADGLALERDGNGTAIMMPQFGGVILEENVQIGANTVIARGAIDDTVVRRGSKIDNQCFISHNVILGEDTLLVGETIMFGSATTGARAYLSGNCTVRNGVHIGADALVGMGAVVVKNVDSGKTVKGNPAK